MSNNTSMQKSWRAIVTYTATTVNLEVARLMMLLISTKKAKLILTLVSFQTLVLLRRVKGNTSDVNEIFYLKNSVI